MSSRAEKPRRLTKGARLDLVREVYLKVYHAVDSFCEGPPARRCDPEDDPRPIGADLAYILGAIAGEGACEIDARDSIVAFLRKTFPKRHPIWRFVVLLPGSEA